MAKKKKPINVATATDEELASELKRIMRQKSPMGSQDIRAEMARRRDAQYQAKFPNIPPGALRCKGQMKDECIDWKRFDHEGFDVEADCPTCGKLITKFYGSYFSYPPMGEPFWARMRCMNCENKFGHEDQGGEYGGHRIAVQINITLSAPTTLPKKKEYE